MSHKLFFLLFFCGINFAISQNFEYPTSKIPENLKENANSVIRYQSIDIDVVSQKSMNIKTQKVITVFNSKGISNVDAREYYSDSQKISSIQAIIYSATGRELKKVRRTDFKDQSISDGFSISNDGRYLFLDYTPTEYPFTVVFECEIKSSNTAFIPAWNPIDDYLESVEKSEITVHFPSNLGFKYKEFNFTGHDIKKTESSNLLHYGVENLVAEKFESYSPSPTKIWPRVKFGLEKFYLEGVEGSAKTWEDFGAWTYNSLLKDTEELPDETISKIKALVANETDPMKKAQLVYQYVQNKTRYVSIQLGIGGWKPMLAKDVDRLGYGDCKALTNYTRVLLKNVGVESYYTEIYGDSNKQDFETDFVAMQGNHVILALPNKDKMTFLECTNQTMPFAFQGDFTDDRFALVIKPNKGEIIKTNEYSAKTNSQFSKGNCTIDSNGNLTGTVKITSKGIQYQHVYFIEKESKEDIDKHYKNQFDWINNLKLDKIKFSNNKNDVEFTEDLQIAAAEYAKSNGDMVMLPVNVFNQNTNIPQRYRFRKNPFEITRGFYDEDEIEIHLPEGYTLVAKPDDVELKNQFGDYIMKLVIVNPNVVIYKRSLEIYKGLYDKQQYEEYRKFSEEIARTDNSKIVLTKKS